MNANPSGPAKKTAETALVRSSAAEYLTFVAASGKGSVEAVYDAENVWLTQKMMGLLYDVETHTINYHLKKIFADSELQEDAVIRNFRITAADGKTYETQHYNLSAIIAVGYKVNSERAVQFRKWATAIIEQFTIKGFVLDDERLKNDGSILTKQYFEEHGPFTARRRRKSSTIGLMPVKTAWVSPLGKTSQKGKSKSSMSSWRRTSNNEVRAVREVLCPRPLLIGK